ncbi:MAG: RHS repeat-associated core domain-containing protein [Verrucomicrobiota bacterium]
MEGPQFTHYTDDTLNFEWNGENRLSELIDKDGNTVAEYVYDYLGRRVMKTTTSEAPQGAGTVFFIYDGWNVIAEYEDSPAVAGQAAATSIGNTDAPTRVLCWGRDLSGSLQGAGGVGGLLSIKQNSGSNAGMYYYGADGNGNIATIVERDGSGSGADEVAYYGYDAFGNEFPAFDLDGSGYINENRWRFSSKRIDEETGFYYYGFRYYEPLLGRWLNRDPIGESGGENILAFYFNDLLNFVDLLGMDRTGSPGSIKNSKVADNNRPGFFDQLNPGGIIGDSGDVDYTDYFDERFPESVAGAKSTLEGRIISHIKSNYCYDQGDSFDPDELDELSDIDIKPDMERFGDTPQNWWEANINIGHFEFKFDNVSITWRPDCCFEFTATMYVEE